MSVNLKQWDTALLFTHLQVQVWVRNVSKQTNKAGFRNYIFPFCDSEKLSLFIIGVFIKHFYKITFSLIILPSVQILEM